MGLFVAKFGGTSVATPAHIQRVAERMERAWRAGHQLVIVVSAMAGETDRLVGLAQGIRPDADGRELDVLLATGEQVTIALLALALDARGIPARSYTGAQVQIRTDNAYNKARITDIEGRRIQADLAENRVVVVAGFQGIDTAGNITTLGRGGSDTTAVALAAALEADECQIFTDVDGVYTTDPRVEPRARRLNAITFEEMLEMASLGSKVLQIRAVEFAGKYHVPLRVCSSFEEGPGTLITLDEETSMETAWISGIAFNRDEAQITVAGAPDHPGIAHRILGPVAEANIEVDMIVQNVGADGSTDFTFTVHKNDYDRALEILRPVCQDPVQADRLEGDSRIGKVSLVGVGMRSHAGIASTMFEALARERINIRMISTSEIKISVVVDEKYLELAVRSLHDAFQLDREPPATAESTAS